MDKGARVRIVGGRQGKGQLGAIFWKGPDKFNGGERFGVKADDGETYWVSERDVEDAAGAPPAPAAPRPTEGAAGEVSFQKGDRVAFTSGGRDQAGSVFWTGPSKSGPGQRLGIKPDDGGETVWLDARLARAAGAAAPTAAHPDGARADVGFDDDDAPPWAPPLTADELPDAPPWDDDAIARFASDDDDDHG